MIAPWILMFLTVAAAFPKDHRYRNRQPNVPIPSTSLHNNQWWSRPFYGPILQTYQGSLSGHSTIQGGANNVMSRPFVIPATLRRPPSVYGQLNSPKQQVIVLTGNTVVSLGGTGKGKSKDKGKGKDKKTQRGNIVQIFIARNNGLSSHHHLHAGVLKDTTKTLSIGGEAEIKKLALGGETIGDILAIKDVELGLADAVLVDDLLGDKLLLGEVAVDQMEDLKELVAEAIFDAAVQGEVIEGSLLPEALEVEAGPKEQGSLVETVLLGLIPSGQEQGATDVLEDVEATLQGLAVEAELPLDAVKVLDGGVEGSVTKEQTLADSVVLTDAKAVDIVKEPEVELHSVEGELSLNADLDITKGADVAIGESSAKEKVTEDGEVLSVAKTDEERRVQELSADKELVLEGSLDVDIEKSSSKETLVNLEAAESELVEPRSIP